MSRFGGARLASGLMACSSAIALLAGAGAHAQQAQQTGAAGGGSPSLEEIVVTSDRKNSYSADLVQAGSFRGARQLDTPLTINVVPEEVLQSQQDLSILDALKNTAGVNQAQTSTVVYNNLAIRGIAVDNRANYRLDGALPIINLVDLPLEDKARVEALKGASALYYGFTTPSGVINLTMKRPTPDLTAEVKSFGDSNGSAGIHADIGDTIGMFGFRINGVHSTVDSGITSIDGHRNLVSGAFDFKPLDDLTVSLDYEHIEKTIPEPGAFRYLTLPTPTAANFYPSVALPPLLKPSANFAPSWGYNKASEDNTLLKVDWKISSAWALDLYAGQSDASRDRRFSTLQPTNLVTGAGTLSVSLQSANYENRHLRSEIAGTFETGPLIHELLIGASVNDRDQLSPTARVVTYAQNFLNPVVVPETTVPLATAGVRTRIQDIGEYAFDRIKYDDWLQLLGGIRNSNYTEENLDPDVTTFRLVQQSGSAGAVIKPWDWTSLYATYIEGLQSTPAAPFTAANAGQQLGATTATQYEGGVKIEPKAGLLFQLAYFDIDQPSAYINSSNIYVLDGRAKFKGEEISLTGEVTHDFSLYASAMFLSAKQVAGAPTTVSVNSKTKAVTISPTIVGKWIDDTPAETFSLSGEYRLDDLAPGLTVNAGAFYTAKRAINPLNEAWVPGYTLVNLGVGYAAEVDDHLLTFRLNAENVGQVRYWAGTGSSILSEGAPAVVKFSVSAMF